MFSQRICFAVIAVIAIAAAFTIGLPTAAVSSEGAVVIPAPQVDIPKAAGPLQTAVIAGGCFWGVQGVYEHMHGVHEALSGYSGGDKSTAQYNAVTSGRTGHAEAVQITFDPKEVSFGEILHVYFSVVHDPTLLNRQGPDTGTQYRSNIFYSNESQREIAQAYIAQLNKAGVFGRAIVTRVDPLEAFYPAEDYHQDFLLKNPRFPYIVINDLPKIENLMKVFPVFYRAEPVKVTDSQ